GGIGTTMKIIRYDNAFNANEWFIIIVLLVGTIAVILAPKRFTIKQTCLFLTCGIFFGFIFDHTLSVFPVSYYDINDTSSFEVMDSISHLMYAPFGYFFFYFYDFFSITPRLNLPYILLWAFASVGAELI